MRKILYPAGLLIFAGAAFLVLSSAAREEGPPSNRAARPVKTTVIQIGALSASRQFPGKVEAARKVNLSFRVSGPLISLPVKEGQMVRKGDLLARIDPRDFEIRLAQISSGLAEARANLKAMRTGARPEDLAMLEQRLASAKAQLRKAKSDYDRAKDLYVRNVISSEELDKHRTDYQVAAAAADMAGQDLRKGKEGSRTEDIEAMEARIKGLESQQRDAAAALDDTYLRAPFSGFVAGKFVESFQFVQAKEPIVSLQDVSQVEICIDVPEKDVTRITGNEAPELTAAFDALPGQRFEVKVKEVGMEADRYTQTYPVTLVMDQPKGAKVLSGMTATVNWRPSYAATGSQTESAAPVGAVFADERGDPFVWVLDTGDMRVHKKPVSVGEMTGEMIEIRDGLQPGDTIVTAGVHFLTEGQRVRYLEEAGGAE